MATIILRLTKGTPLSNSEADANINNLNQELITKLPIASYTAADILTKLKTVDGNGSGLDADLLDGLTSSSILPITTSKSSIVSRDSTGNFTANLITGIVTTANALNGANATGFISRVGTDIHSSRVVTGSGNDITVANGDGVSGNPTISAGTNLSRRDATNTYTLPQNFALITANALSNDGNSNLFTGVSNLSTTSTNGFLYVPMITGKPTGTPTTNAGRSPMLWDATNSKLWVYSGGIWNNVVSVTPVFSAQSTAIQTVSSGVLTKVALPQQNRDTNGNFDTTLFRFIAPIAGDYHFDGVVRGAGTSVTAVSSFIFKNGVELEQGGKFDQTALSGVFNVLLNTTVFLNAGDYVELFGFVVATNPTFDVTLATRCSRFSGYLVRAA